MEKISKTPEEVERYNLVKWSMELTKEEQNYLAKLIDEGSKRNLECYELAWDMVLRANFEDENVEKLNDQVVSEGLKFREYIKNGGDYIMAIKNNADKIIKDYKKGKQNNVKESELIKDLAANYKITVNAVKSIIKEHKKELQDPEKALDYIFDEEEKKQIEETFVTCKKSLQVDKEPKKEYKFKVEEPKVFNAVGEYATYKVDKTNKEITVGELAFRSESGVTDVYEMTGKKIKADYESKQRELLKQYEESLKNAKESAEETIAAIKQYLA